MVKQEIRRLLSSPFLYISIVILLVVLFTADAEDIALGDPIYQFDFSCDGLVTTLCPVLCVIAVADSYLVEKKSGYRYALLSRTKRLRYSLTKMGIAVCASMCTMFVVQLLWFLILIVIAKILNGQILWGFHEYNTWKVTDLPLPLVHHHLLRYVGRLALCNCLFSAIFPGIALITSIFINNRYVVLLAPFIYYEVTNIVFIGIQWFYFSPGVLTANGRADLLPYLGMPFRAVVITAYVLAETLIFVFGVKRQTYE